MSYIKGVFRVLAPTDTTEKVRIDVGQSGHSVAFELSVGGTEDLIVDLEKAIKAAKLAQDIFAEETG